MLALSYHTQTAYAPFFRSMFLRLRTEPEGEREALTRELEDFLDSPAINKRTDDDKTLLLATRRPPVGYASPTDEATQTAPTSGV